MDGLISLASAALSVAADAILKPLRYAKNGIKEIFETIVKKLPDLPSAASKILKGLANTVDGLWLVGRKLKDSIIKGINAVIEFIAKHTREAYQSVRNKLKKEVTEAATETAAKGVKEATEDVIEDAVSDAAIKGASGFKLETPKYNTSKLQHEFKHASDFGINGSWNKANGEAFKNALIDHVNNADIIVKSTYRTKEDVIVYINKTTGLGTYFDLSGNFVCGWKLSPNQLQFHLTNGIPLK